MNCACGHDHHRPPGQDAVPDDALPLRLAAPMVALNGRLICQDAGQMLTALTLLPEHVRLSRQEKGCLRFDMWQDEDPLVWHLAELFVNDEAYGAHQARTQSSEWGRASITLGREFRRAHVEPHLRSETRADHDRLDDLLQAAFGGTQEARLLRHLREDGDLSLSLLAEAAGCVLGHVALSPLQAEARAFALAPVAVRPGAQGLGIGRTLISEALAWAGDAAVVVLGDPGFYGPFGFGPAPLESPWAGPHLQIRGQLPPGSTITHARAFGG